MRRAVPDGATRGVRCGLARGARNDVQLDDRDGRDHSTKGRKEKQRKFDPLHFEIEHEDGTVMTCSHNLHLKAGRVHETEHDSIGELVDHPLEHKVIRRKNKGEGCRWYLRLRLDCPNGETHVKGRTVHQYLVPVHAQDEDERNECNRAENLRLVPPAPTSTTSYAAGGKTPKASTPKANASSTSDGCPPSASNAKPSPCSDSPSK